MNLESQVKDTIIRYKLFTKKHKIAVAASGGKDSTTLLYILKKLGYNVTAMTVDAVIGKYTEENLENLRGFCKKHKIPLIEISFRDEYGAKLCYIKSLLHSKGLKYNSCTICGVLRRSLINKHAKKHKFDRLATGHNLDDEAQAALMNIFRNDKMRFARQGPKVGVLSSNQFVQRVKPLYFVPEKDIEAYSKKMGFPVVYGRCPCAAEAYRMDVRGFIAKLKPLDPNICRHIVDFTLNCARKKTEGRIQTCTVCKEPSNSDVCKACQIIQAVGDKK